MPGIRQYNGGIPFASIQATDAFVIDRIGVGTGFVEAMTGGIVDVVLGFEFLGNAIPITSEILGAIYFPRAVTFPGNFVGSGGIILVHPTASFVCTITKNGATVGGMTISTGGVYSFTSSSGNPVVYGIGDYMTVIAPSVVDLTAENLLFSFLGAFT